MAGLNKSQIIGRVGKDPELKYLPTGGAVTNISIATSEKWKDKQTGQQQERTEWHRIVFFNKLAEIVGQYVRKGSQLYVEGSLRTRKWQGQDGKDVYTTEIIATEMQMLDSKPQGQQAAPSHQYARNQPQGASQQQYANASGGSASLPNQQPNRHPEPNTNWPDDDDIPF